MVGENALLSLEDAIYKATGLPAKILGQNNIGLIKEGMIADITIFDAQEVADHNKFGLPAVKPLGVEHVFVDGQPALLKGAYVHQRKGRFLTLK